MANLDKRIEWHTIDEAAAKAITDVTKVPGKVCEIPMNQAPINLQGIKGAVSCYISADINSQILQEGLTIGGTQIVIVRTEEDIGKAYNFVMAKSSDGKLYFCGPFKKFPVHHFDINSSIEIERLFGYTPFSEPNEH